MYRRSGVVALAALSRAVCAGVPAAAGAGAATAAAGELVQRCARAEPAAACSAPPWGHIACNCAASGAAATQSSTLAAGLGSSRRSSSSDSSVHASTFAEGPSSSSSGKSSTNSSVHASTLDSGLCSSGSSSAHGSTLLEGPGSSGRSSCSSSSGSSNSNSGPNRSPNASGDGLLAGGIWSELRSWARFLLPSRYVAVFYRTPPEVATAMLKLAGVGPNDVVYDLGCGDGSIVLVAAQLGAKRIVGIELDPTLAAAARRAVAAAGLGPRASIECGDAAAADVSAATVITLYLSAKGNRMLLAALAPSLRRGTRVVSHYFPVEGWEGALTGRSIACGVDLYCYSVP